MGILNYPFIFLSIEKRLKYDSKNLLSKKAIFIKKNLGCLKRTMVMEKDSAIIKCFNDIGNLNIFF